MKKKFQVYISSTFTDMIDERQAAVTAVLNAGHIPAGMELFKPGDLSQKETIRRWIQESDVYLLILGGRYGVIDQVTGKSSIHTEYDYAGELGKRRFAMVINDIRLDEKASADPDYLEREHFEKYQAFKTELLGNNSKFYEDIKDIKLITMESLNGFEADDKLIGWVKADQIGSTEETLRENIALLKENVTLKAEVEKLKEQQSQQVLISGWEYEDLKKTLQATLISLPKEVSKSEKETSLLNVLVTLSDTFANGITNSSGTSDNIIALYYNVAPKLISYGVLEKVKVPGVRYEKIQTSKEGHKFLAKYNLERLKYPEIKKPTKPLKKTGTRLRSVFEDDE